MITSIANANLMDDLLVAWSRVDPMSAHTELVFPDGEMAVRVKTLPIWNDASPSIRIAVSMCLTSSAPMLVWCGPQLSLIYNDAAIRLMGHDHPGAFGNGPEVLAGRWRTIRVDLEQARRSRCVVQTADMLLTPLIEGDEVVAVAGSVALLAEETSHRLRAFSRPGML